MAFKFNPFLASFDFVGPGGSFDPANPGPIGSGTADIGSFTLLNVSPTWNDAGTNFAGIYGRVTNTASGANSKLIDLGTAAAGSLFSVGTNGMINALGINGTVVQLQSYGFDCLRIDVNYGSLLSRGNYTVPLANSGMLWLDPVTYAKNGWLRRTSAWTYQFGENHATTPTAQTIKAHDVTTGNGSDLSIEAGVGSVSDGVVNIGRTTNSRVGFFYANSHAQINTSGGSASHNTGTGSPVYDDDRFDNYTIAQVVAALRSYGLLA